MTLSRPRTTRRVLRGSVLGLGLVVAGGVTAPAALAVVGNSDEAGVPVDGDQSPAPLVQIPAGESPSGESPYEEPVALAPALEGNFGSGKDFTVHVDPYGPVPDDLDLSGAVFRATPTTTPVAGEPDTLAGDPTSYTCTTDVDGTCTFDGPQRHFSFWDIFGSLDLGQLGIPGGAAPGTSSRTDPTSPCRSAPTR